MYPPHHLGGYELSCRDVVDRWRAEGNEALILTTSMRVDGVTEPTDEYQRGIRRTLEFYWEDHEMLSPHPLRRWSIERHNQRELRRALADFQPDVVSVWHMGAMSMALLTTLRERGVPMAFSVCDDWMIYGPDVDAWIRVFRTRPRLGRVVGALTKIPTELPTFDATTPFCFNSAWVRDRAQAQSVLEMVTETVVYTGIDPADFPIDASPRPPWRWRMLCVGRQEDRKGTHVAVEALAHLPDDAHLEICGPGDSAYLDRLAQLARPYGDRVTFGTSSRDELREHYRAADVFLFPVTWDEPFGLVPVEAMACGVPVIATGTGGSAEFLIDGRNCLIVPRSDPQALAAAVRRLATDEALRERLREGGFVTAAEMTVDRLASALWEWHVAAANGFADGRPADLPPPASSLR